MSAVEKTLREIKEDLDSRIERIKRGDLPATTAYEHLRRAGDIADEAMAVFYHGDSSGPEKINRVLDALSLISRERDAYEKTIGEK